MEPNILLIETDTETITLFSTEPGNVIELERVQRPRDFVPPTEAPMIIGRRKIYRMKSFSVPTVTEEMARRQSKKARKLISEFICRTGTLTGRPSISQIEIDRETMTKWHEVMEKNEAGLWATVHHHRDPLEKKRQTADPVKKGRKGWPGMKKRSRKSGRRGE